MADDTLNTVVRSLASVVRNGSPLVLAAIGETFTERAGIINLSLDGSLMLSALAGLVIGINTQSVLIGALAAMIVGMIVALIVAASSIQLKQNQVAVGFILTLLCRDLAITLGKPFLNVPALSVLYLPIPILKDIPVVGPILFDQDLFTYLSLIAIVVSWFWIFRTAPGLTLRSVGERPAATFARGKNVNSIRYLYAAVGGSLVGLGGAAYTLSISTIWKETPNGGQISGNGWIALALVIFGGWYPLRVAFGVYLVAALRILAGGLQGGAIPIALLNLIPWLLMILTLLAVSGPYLETLLKILPTRLHPLVRSLLRARPPAALGAVFEQEGKE